MTSQPTQAAAAAPALGPTSGHQATENGFSIPNALVIEAATVPFAVEVPDLLIPPTHLANIGYRLRAVDTGTLTDPRRAREPFLGIIDGLRIDDAQLCATTRLAVRGTAAEPSVQADLVLAALGDESVAVELAALDRHVRHRLLGPSGPFAVERLPVGALGFPRRGHVTLIRQREIEVGDPPQRSAALPVRFAYPGPDASARLLGALLAAGPGTELFVTVSPTVVREDEWALLHHLHQTAAQANGLDAARIAATAADATISFGTEVSVIQIAVTSLGPVPRVDLRAIANALSAPFDTQVFDGARVVAMPTRFVAGGSSIESARDPSEILHRLGYGLPMIGHPRRAVRDLVTATEVGYTFGWVTDEHGAIPGAAPTTGAAPAVDAGARIGREPLGRPAPDPESGP